MSQDRPAPGSAEEWLSRARGDLALAQVPLPPGGFFEDLCFHAQQAAEKALKAVYVRHGWAFRYIHDVDALIGGLEDHGLKAPASVQEALSLTLYARATRYPGPSEPVTEQEYRRAVERAAAVVKWAESVMSSQ